MTYSDYNKRHERIVSSDRRLPKIVYPSREGGRTEIKIEDFDLELAYSIMSRAAASDKGESFLKGEDPLAGKLRREVLPLLVERLELEEDRIVEKRLYEVIRGALRDSGLESVSRTFARLAGLFSARAPI